METWRIDALEMVSIFFILLASYISFRAGRAEERFKWHCKLKIGECDPSFAVMQCGICGELTCNCE